MIYALYIVLFAVCIIIAALAVNEIFVSRRLQNSIITYTTDSSKKRRIREERLRQLEGEQSDTNFMYSVDILLEQSGIKKYIPFLNSELYIISALICSLAAFSVGCMFSGWLAGIVCLLAVALVFYIIPVIMANNNYKNTEKDILQFVNLVGSYSATSNNIITIFGSIYLFLNEPLKHNVKMCYDEAQMTGDVSAALMHLETRINHPMFRMIIRNIEIASRHEANYSEVTAAIREIVREYIRNQEEVKSMISSARSQLLILVVAGAVIIYMVNGLLEGTDLFMVLTTTLAGQIILGALAVIAFVCIYVFIRFGARE